MPAKPAQIKPTTYTRIDFGLCLRDYKGKLPKRVQPAGGLDKGDRITHRIEITKPSDIRRRSKEMAEDCLRTGSVGWCGVHHG